MATIEGSASQALVAQAATGDQAAFSRLVAEHHASMARVAYAITGDGESAADAVQTAWSIAWRRLRTLRDHGAVRAWLLAIAANEARQVLRAQRRRTVIDISSVSEPVSPHDPADRITTLDLVRVLRSLNPDERTLLALRFAAGLESPEIAAQLGLSASGVRSRIARLLERIRMDLGHD